MLRRTLGCLRLVGAGALLSDLVVAVLAAGASRRLGRAKQLVPIGGEPLLRRQCRCACRGEGPVVVILGCDEEQYREVIIDLPVDARNDEWAEGLPRRCGPRSVAASSRVAGSAVRSIPHHPSDLRGTTSGVWRRRRRASHVGATTRVRQRFCHRYYDHVLALRATSGSFAAL
jgi:hypothetical protein